MTEKTMKMPAFGLFTDEKTGLGLLFDLNQVRYMSEQVTFTMVTLKDGTVFHITERPQEIMSKLSKAY